MKLKIKTTWEHRNFHKSRARFRKLGKLKHTIRDKQVSWVFYQTLLLLYQKVSSGVTQKPFVQIINMYQMISEFQVKAKKNWQQRQKGIRNQIMFMIAFTHRSESSIDAQMKELPCAVPACTGTGTKRNEEKKTVRKITILVVILALQLCAHVHWNGAVRNLNDFVSIWLWLRLQHWH